MTPVQKTATSLAAVVALMVGLSFAAVPFYNWFCRVTGFAGTTSVAEKPSDVILDQTVTVRFDASLDRDMPWTFKPMQRKMDIRIGETGLAFYEAYNPTNHVVAGQASYNVTPDQAGGYFTKIACFCFTMQVLQPGERAIMPVTFYVDPDIVNDPEAQYIHEITLSYTFHDAYVRVYKQAGLAATAANPLN
ncbi:cytochrome c oxidase assembly protein [Pseudorhodobacter sp.]|uniref:cytochrome c oxidase assembly protein n=1 Tax=Pseudorhodobacter sp. TaxID=1934400 RepID=UPI0026470565|nr:cytochrome c oxidase assembly protein [Pseudorhodobacter sp.]MDN5785594.1 cytochrome c oxidase assembly protein [Pseudorhodobacter sp.]